MLQRLLLSRTKVWFLVRNQLIFYKFKFIIGTSDLFSIFLLFSVINSSRNILFFTFHYYWLFLFFYSSLPESTTGPKRRKLISHHVPSNSARVTSGDYSFSSSFTHRRSSLRSAASGPISDLAEHPLRACQPNMPNSAASRGSKMVSISAQRKSPHTRSASRTIFAKPGKLLPASSVCASIQRAARFCAASRSIKKDRSSVADQIAPLSSRKICEVCSRPASHDATLSAGKKRNVHGKLPKNTTWLLCGSCEDAFHSSCLPDESDISAVGDDGTWICPVCFGDSELKCQNPVEQTETNRPCRAFSSAWSKSCCNPNSLGSSTVTHNCLTRRKNSSSSCTIALHEPSPTSSSVAIGEESFFDFSSSLSGICKSAIQRASLKLPRYTDRNEAQRADARQKLFSAMKEKGMIFQDGLSYDWPDCPQVWHLSLTWWELLSYNDLTIYDYLIMKRAER